MKLVLVRSTVTFFVHFFGVVFRPMVLSLLYARINIKDLSSLRVGRFMQSASDPWTTSLLLVGINSIYDMHTIEVADAPESLAREVVVLGNDEWSVWSYQQPPAREHEGFPHPSPHFRVLLGCHVWPVFGFWVCRVLLFICVHCGSLRYF